MPGNTFGTAVNLDPIDIGFDQNLPVVIVLDDGITSGRAMLGAQALQDATGSCCQIRCTVSV